jgi:Type ISP C-terminal specificity domain
MREFLTLEGIPPETYEYRLGNRSALEWVIEQYQVSTDNRSGITNDPTGLASAPPDWESTPPSAASRIPIWRLAAHEVA